MDGRGGIETLVDLLEEAFRGRGIEASNESHWIAAAMITHDAYHAGEINHLRSMLGSDDRWRYVQEGSG